MTEVRWFYAHVVCDACDVGATISAVVPIEKIYPCPFCGGERRRATDEERTERESITLGEAIAQSLNHQ